MKVRSIFLSAALIIFCCCQTNTQGSTNAPPSSPAAATTAEHLSVNDFTKIANTSGDGTPLVPELAKAGPHWTNAVVTIAMKYSDGRVFNEQVPATSRNVQGRYIVTTAESQFYHQKMTAISTFDKKASVYRTWSIFGTVVTGQTTVYDFDKKIYATSAAYGDGFTEVGVGSYSDVADTSKIFVYKNGDLFMTRVVTVTPK